MSLNAFQKELHEVALEASRSFKKAEVDLIDILLKIDEARVFLALGYSSLYAYAHESLGLSEANAYAFTSVARKSKQIPEIRTEIKSGRLSVSKAKRVLSVITPQNHEEWISKAAILSKNDLEREVVRANPKAAQREFVRAISDDRVSLKLGISDDLLNKLRRAQVLLMNKGRRNMNLEATLDALAEDFLKSYDPLRKTARPLEGRLCPGTKLKPGPAGDTRKPTLSMTLRREVLQRDRGRCQYRGENEKRCEETVFVEIHHKIPVSQGGQHRLENLITLCSRHHNFHHDTTEHRRRIALAQE